ncbi:MAG: hypothetical protein AAGC68_04375, partial [Verrucomicrobiota bacterium]
MRIPIFLALGVSFFPLLGNGQELTSPASVPVSGGYGVQGNVATNRKLHEAEMDRALAAARAKKELMAQAAAQGVP